MIGKISGSFYQQQRQQQKQSVGPFPNMRGLEIESCIVGNIVLPVCALLRRAASNGKRVRGRCP